MYGHPYSIDGGLDSERSHLGGRSVWDGSIAKRKRRETSVERSEFLKKSKELSTHEALRNLLWHCLTLVHVREQFFRLK